MMSLLIISSIILTGCASEGQITPFFTSTYTAVTSPISANTPTNRIVEVGITPESIFTTTPSSTSTPTHTPSRTPTITPSPSQTFTITVSNPFPWEAYIFMDDVYIMSINQSERKSLSGVQQGKHIFHYCQVKKLYICVPQVSINVSQDSEWEVGQLPSGKPTMEFVTPTRIAFGSLINYHTIKVNNKWPFTIYIFKDDELFLSIPSFHYLTFQGAPTGKYIFKFCRDKDQKECIRTREVIINKDVEWWISP
ncbi:hypothetical protein ACFLUA_00005 [Chloroflexota bacterium]